MLVDQSVVCPVLIGRAAPLSTVVNTLERARSSHGGTLLVSGEAGIGKSRLGRAMLERAGELGFVMLQGACFETDRAHPYAPLLDLVRVLATTRSNALAAHYFAPAGAELVTHFPELRTMFPDVTPLDALDPEAERRRLFHSVAASLQAVAREQPLLLVVEDVHWSDDATLDLVMHLARQIGTQPIALVLTFRSDEIGPRLAKLLADLDRARCASEVSLRPLAPGEVSAMLHAIFGAQSPPGGSFVQDLHALTEGNPFFVEEMLKSLLEAGDIVRTEDAWRARPLADVQVPRTATEAVERRLAGLSEPARRIASVAAVAGRRFDFDLLQRLTQHDEMQLLALVKELVGAQLVAEETADRFAFRHALTRETIRAGLMKRERVALHRAIAAALEEAHAASSQDSVDDLAYHTFEAGEWDAAIGYALRAASQARTLCAPREALRQLERAVSAMEHAGRRLDPAVLLERGRAHETLGAFPHANDDFAAALSAARANQDRRAEWAALHALGMLWSARDYEQAGAYRREALDVARAIGDPAIIARSLNRVGNWYVNREQPHSGIPSHAEALLIFERAGDARGVAETVDLLAMAHHIAGMQRSAVDLYERAVRQFTALEDRRGLTNALGVTLVCGPSHHASSGPVASSAETDGVVANDRLFRLAADIGWRAGEAFTRWIVADCLAWRGDLARALRIGGESLAIAEEIVHLEWQCGARRALGAISLELGATADAIAQLESAHDIARRLGSAAWIRWTGAPLAGALARAALTDRATALLDDVDRRVAVSPEPERRSATPTLGARQLVLARAEVALAVGQPAETLRLTTEFDVTSTPRVALLRGQAFAALEQWADATSLLDVAREGALAQHARPILWRVDAARGGVYLGERRRLEARRAFDEARATAATLMDGLEDDVIAVFSAAVDRLAPPSPERTTRQETKATFGGLTQRERDTAALIAQGKSNRAIARALGIGERTVEGYVAAALAKLDFSSRAQIAVWAAGQGLVPREKSTGKPRG